MTDSVFDEMKEVLALQKKAHIDEGPASYELRLDRLNRLSQMLKKYSDEIVDTISEDYGTRDKNSTFLSEVMSSLGSVDYSIKNLKRNGFMLFADNLPEGHAIKFVLIDDKGTIRKYYDGTDNSSQEILKRDVAQLVKDLRT